MKEPWREKWLLAYSKSCTNPSPTRNIILPQYPPRRYHMFDISPQNNRAICMYMCQLPKPPCVEMTQTISFPNENHLCSTPTHCTQTRVNPLMSRKDINLWIACHGNNPLATSILRPWLHSFIFSIYIYIYIYILTHWCAMDWLTS